MYLWNTKHALKLHWLTGSQTVLPLKSNPHASHSAYYHKAPYSQEDTEKGEKD